jgi:AcrR family transcriptional regulator
VNEPPDARARILDAAEELFARQGFDATATSSIAKLAAVPKGLVFYYFPTKPDLLRALVSEQLGLGPIDVAELVEPGNAVGSLLNLTNKLYQIQATSQVLRVIIWREQHTHPEVKANLIEHRNQIRTVIERVLQASFLTPIPVAASRLRTAAEAWLAVLTAWPLSDPQAEADDSRTRLSALAELICAGLTSQTPVKLA